MASVPKRRRSRKLPPDLSDLMNKLIKCANSFISEFDNKERDMERIKGEFKKIADEVSGEMETMNKRRRRAVITTGTAAAVGLLAASITGGLSLIAVGAGTGLAAVCVSTAVIKTIMKNGSATKVQDLGKEFMKIVEPLKDDLEQIKTICKSLEEVSAETQAKCTLEEMEEFKMILRRVSELGKKTEESVHLTGTLILLINAMVMFITEIFNVTELTGADEEFIKSVIQSAERCQKIIHEFQTMKNELKEFNDETS